MTGLNPIQPALDALAHLLDVPASLSHLSREAQVDALTAQHSRPTTLAGLAKQALKVSTFMGQGNFIADSRDSRSHRQSLRLLFQESLDCPEAFMVTLSAQGEVWITAMHALVWERVNPVTAEPERTRLISNGQATVKVTRLEDRWSVEVVSVRWASPHITGMIQRVLSRLDPALRLGDAQVAELKLDALMPVKEAFIRLIDAPKDLSGLSRPRQLEALRERYAQATSPDGLLQQALRQATFMGEADSCDLMDDRLVCEHVDGDDEVSWSVSLDGQVTLTCAGVDDDGDRCELSVRIIPRDGSWTVRIEDSQYPLRVLADRINEVLGRFHPRLKLTARQLARITFYD